MKRLPALLLLLTAPALFAQSPMPPSYLKDYVAKDDGVYSWKLEAIDGKDGGTIANIKLVSQKWQGETWEHAVQIFLPQGVKPTATVVLYNTGGAPNSLTNLLGLSIAERAKAPVVFLFGIPKQPLYGKREDGLIAETFVKFLETKDSTWPLLFPMVKSVVKCMDAVQAFAKQEWKQDVTGFIITGASKRGWTSWLVAATEDKRVKAIAPMVFDSLKLIEQMPHQVKSFGSYSLMIKDYQDRKLLPLPETDEAKMLWAMVDPWMYREKITIPKLIVNGGNDPYWATDALSLYWNDLKGPKAVVTVPNAGHDLRPMNDPGAAKISKDPLPMKAVDTLAGFCYCIIYDKPFPSLEANADSLGGAQIKFPKDPIRVRTWKAENDTRDFRKVKFEADEWRNEKGAFAIGYSLPLKAKYTAHFLEAEFEVDGHKFCLSTPTTIVEKK